MCVSCEEIKITTKSIAIYSNIYMSEESQRLKGIKMAYLIVKCEELDDQYECDANRTPMFICNDWVTLKLDYSFEVYRINDDNTFDLVKDYETPMEFGMALYYWNEDDDCEIVKPTIVKKWQNRTRNNSIPKKVKKILKDLKNKGVDIDNWLQSCGYITWYDEHNNYCVYGEYADSDYSLGY